MFPCPVCQIVPPFKNHIPLPAAAAQPTRQDGIDPDPLPHSFNVHPVAPNQPAHKKMRSFLFSPERKGISCSLPAGSTRKEISSFPSQERKNLQIPCPPIKPCWLSSPFKITSLLPAAFQSKGQEDEEIFPFTHLREKEESPAPFSLC